MDSYRPHSRAGQRFRTFHMFIDELCLQLVGDYRTAVRREDRAQQSDLLRLQGVGQHHPECSPAATGNNLCVVCCAKYNKYLKKHPATAYGNMPHKRRKTTFWCSTCHKYLCLRVGSTCWSDYHTKVQFSNHPKFHHVVGRGEATGSFTPQSLRPRLPAWPLITLDPALSPLSLAVSFVFCVYIV